MPKIGWKPLLLAALCGGVGAAAAEPFTFVAWNVGHFADGRKGTSTIATTNVPARRAAYRALFRELDAKVVGLVEYSPLFDAAGNVLTANAILDDYPHRLEGPVRGYHVNSVFLKDCDVLASRVVDYADHHQRTHHHDARVRIGGHEALVSITHLEPDWPTDMRAKRAAQMRQLVDDLAKEPRVVIAGDFNIVDKAELQPLLDAGYTHVSAAMLPTWPAKKPDQPIDHIFVKGFRASDFRVIARPDLSDHCLVACSLEPCETAAPGSAGSRARPARRSAATAPRAAATTSRPSWTTSSTSRRIPAGTRRRRRWWTARCPCGPSSITGHHPLQSVLRDDRRGHLARDGRPALRRRRAHRLRAVGASGRPHRDADGSADASGRRGAALRVAPGGDSAGRGLD